LVGSTNGTSGVANFKALNEKRKTIEAALKLATPEVPFVDPTNGEKITECKKVFKTIVKTTINK